MNAELDTECILWPGSTRGPMKYGQVYDPCRGKQIGAHVMSYEAFYGPIGRGMSVLHHCDVPLCYNPLHLYEGTHLQNMADVRARKRGRNANKAKTHCRNGHEFDEKNTHHYKGHRRCRACDRERKSR